MVISNREYLAVVKPDGLFLMLELMHFANEVLEPESLKTPAENDVSPRELDMAKALIESMTSEWEPTRYKDQYRDALMELIEEKASKRPPSAKPPHPVSPRMSSTWLPSSRKACKRLNQEKRSRKLRAPSIYECFGYKREDQRPPRKLRAAL